MVGLGILAVHSTTPDPGARRSRLILERLDDRTLLSTITVIDSGDSGPGTLRVRSSRRTPTRRPTSSPSISAAADTKQSRGNDRADDHQHRHVRRHVAAGLLGNATRRDQRRRRATTFLTFRHLIASSRGSCSTTSPGYTRGDQRSRRRRGHSGGLYRDRLDGHCRRGAVSGIRNPTWNDRPDRRHVRWPGQSHRRLFLRHPRLAKLRGVDPRKRNRTTAAGTGAIANNWGIAVAGDSGPGGLLIGGTASGAGNLISGNTLSGIYCGLQLGVTVQGK